MRDPNKGLLNGMCYRGACNNTPANWYSSVERQHYCTACARKINEYLPPGVAKIVKVV